MRLDEIDTVFDALKQGTIDGRVVQTMLLRYRGYPVARTALCSHHMPNRQCVAPGIARR